MPNLPARKSELLLLNTALGLQSKNRSRGAPVIFKSKPTTGTIENTVVLFPKITAVPYQHTKPNLLHRELPCCIDIKPELQLLLHQTIHFLPVRYGC